MSVAKLRAGSTSDIMKSDEGNDSLDTIRQAIGREPLLSYSRTGDSPMHWIQFLQAFDQQANGAKESVRCLEGVVLRILSKSPRLLLPLLTRANANGEPEECWPLLSPQKVQMQKCDKCSREFCSPINYRRHIRVHRRSLNVDKESHKDRDLLGAFWDKLSLEEAKEIVSFTDVNLEETTGSSIIRALMSLIRQPGFSALPQVYLRAGSALLDIIQARPSRLPIDSQELFSILDDASERTFLCAGTAKSVQKYVFDGEAGKIGLETKNVVACTSFLIEQKLVKAWLADKDAEALRCQKLLVEEEDAAQKRQTEILERKRQKRLRQKEQRAKEQPSEEKTDLKEVTSDSFENPSSSSSPDVFESNSDTIDSPTDHVLSLLEHGESDIEAQFGFNGEHSDSGTFPNVEHRIVQRSGRRHLVHARWQATKSQRGGKNTYHASQSLQVLKPEPSQKHGSIKVWTRKPKPGNDGESLRTRLHEEAINQTDQSRKCEVMIGSIPVTFENSDGRQQGNSLSDSSPFGTNRSSCKLWRPVRHETSGPIPVQSGSREFEVDVVIDKGDDRTMPNESCLRDCAMDENGSEIVNNSHPFFGEIADPEGLVFSSQAAKAFLAQRWKEAIAAEHVKLVLSPQSEPPGRPNRSTLGNAENQISVVEAHNFATQTKPEKNIKIKYIPKQRTVA